MEGQAGVALLCYGQPWLCSVDACSHAQIFVFVYIFLHACSTHMHVHRSICISIDDDIDLSFSSVYLVCFLCV